MCSPVNPEVSMANMKPAPKAAALSVMPSGTYRRVVARPVVEHPHQALTRVSDDLDPCGARAVELAQVLIATLRATPACFGISAPQVGEKARMIAVNVTGHEHAHSCAGLVVLV